MPASRLTTSRGLVVAMACAVALTACSSTNARKKAGDSDDLASAPTPTPAAKAPLTDKSGKPLTKAQIQAAVKAGTLPPSALASVSAAPSSSSGSKRPTASRPAPSVKKLSSGPGFTANEIKIGISLFQPGDIGNQFGIKAAYGDGQKQAQAVVNYINSKGGIAGRKVVPVFYTVDFARFGSIQDGQFEAEACEKWTNDSRVFAVVNTAMARQALLSCLGKKGVPGVHDAMGIDETRLTPYRDYYYSGVGAAALTIDRTATVVAKVLGARGFYKSGAKPTVVGIIHYNDQFYGNVVNKKLVPLIKSFGVKKVVVQAAPRGATTADGSYVARFQAEGVTHVQFLGESNAYPLTFMPAAESQGYRPKYGISTEQSPGFLESTSPIPRAQLANATAIGWSQVLDTSNANDPGPTGPNDRLCLSIEKAAGQDMSQRGARTTATVYCDGLFFLKQNLDRAENLTPAALAKSVASLGTGYSSPGIFNPTSFSATKHDGASTYRDLAFRNGAFVYTSGNKRMPG